MTVLCFNSLIQYYTLGGGGSGDVAVFITLLEIQWGQIVLSAQILRLGNHCCQNNYLVKGCMCINFSTPILDSQFSIKIVLFMCCCFIKFCSLNHILLGDYFAIMLTIFNQIL